MSVFTRLPVLWGLLFLVASCGTETQFSGGSGEADARATQQVDTFTGGVTAGYQPVDIAFVVDTSGSMLDEKEKLEQNMASFVDKFLALSEKIDYRVFFIGIGFDFPDVVSSNPRFSEVRSNVGSFDGAVRAVEFLKRELDSPMQPRQNAMQNLIFVTDDESLDMSAQRFKDEISSLEYRKVRVNGFVGLQEGQNSPGCDIAAVGQVYRDLAADSKHKGLIQDLCTDDWNVMLDELANSILQEVALGVFTLTKPAYKAEGFKVFVDGTLVPENGYTFDESQNAIVFKPDYEPARGAEIRVVYFSMP